MIPPKSSSPHPVESNKINYNISNNEEALDEDYEHASQNFLVEDEGDVFSVSAGSSLSTSPLLTRQARTSRTSSTVFLLTRNNKSEDSNASFVMVNSSKHDTSPVIDQEELVEFENSIPPKETSTTAFTKESQSKNGSYKSPSGFAKPPSHGQEQKNRADTDSSFPENTFRTLFVRGSQLTENQARPTQLHIVDFLMNGYLAHHQKTLDLISASVEEIEQSAVPKDIDACFYTISSSGVTEQDAKVMISIAQKAPLISFRESIEDGLVAGQLDAMLDMDTIRTRLELLLASQFQTQRCSNWPNAYRNLVKREILDSLVVLQSYQSADLDNTIHRHQKIMSFTPWRQTWQRTWRDLLATVSVIGLLAALVVISVFVLAGLRMGQVIQFRRGPSHAVVQHIDYIYQGRTAVVHLDIFQADLTPFTEVDLKSKYNAIHYRILDNDKEQSVPPTNQPELLEPIFQNLFNGSYRIYIIAPSASAQRASVRRRYRQKGAPFRLPGVWLCREDSTPKYFLHIWFANGTRVEGTPQELTWSQPSALITTEFEAETGRIKSGHPDEDYQGYDEMDPIEFWKTKAQSLSDKLSDTIEDLVSSGPSKNIVVKQYQTILCALYMAVQLSLEYWLNSVGLAFMVVSRLVDSLFGSKNFLFRQWVNVLRMAQRIAR